VGTPAMRGADLAPLSGGRPLTPNGPDDPPQSPQCCCRPFLSLQTPTVILTTSTPNNPGRSLDIGPLVGPSLWRQTAVPRFAANTRGDVLRWGWKRTVSWYPGHPDDSLDSINPIQLPTLSWKVLETEEGSPSPIPPRRVFGSLPPRNSPVPLRGPSPGFLVGVGGT
jgi:hypothetical protein